jgi:hypothetical protein
MTALMFNFTHESGKNGSLNAFSLVEVLFTKDNREFEFLSFSYFFVLGDILVKLIVQSEISFGKNMWLNELFGIES